MKKKIYIYPPTIDSPNPYKANLFEALSEQFEVINDRIPSRFSPLNMLCLLFLKLDVLYVNWVEIIVSGSIPWLRKTVFFFVVKMLKLRGVTIIFLLHNKEPHIKSKYGKACNDFMIKNADILLTHSSDGLELFGDNGRLQAYYPHPIILKEELLQKEVEKDIDILIWGAIKPYKGVTQFLQAVKKRELQTKYNIVVAGKIQDSVLAASKGELESATITITDSYPSFEEIDDLIKRAKIVLFTHQDRSVLSSGVLIDTLAVGGLVLGPNMAAFQDMEEEGLAYTYNDEDGLFQMVNNILAEDDLQVLDVEKLREFAKRNSWSIFAENVYRTDKAS